MREHAACPLGRGSIPRVAAVLCTVLLLGGCSSAGAPVADPTTRLAARLTAAYSADSDAAAITALAASGIAVVDGPDGTTALQGAAGGQNRLRLTRWQAADLGLGTATRSGILGADVDALAPMPAGAPPFSYLLAAYVKLGETGGARLLREVMGPQDWAHADAIVFPAITFAAFVADATAFDRAGGTSAQAAATSVTVMDAVSGPCSAVAGFVDSALNYVFNLLQLAPSNSSFVNFFVSIWNGAVSLAHTVIGGLISALTRPVVQAIASAVGAVATLLEVVSLLRPYAVFVRFDPIGNSTSAVPGDVMVKVVNNDLGNWPSWMVDCANAAGIVLPPLTSPKNAPVTWTVLASVDSAQEALFADPDGDPLVEQRSLDTNLHDDGTATLHYVTGQDPIVPANCQQGLPEDGAVPVRVDVRRADVEELQSELNRFLTGALVGGLPGQVQQLVAPVLGFLTSQVTSKLSALVSADFGFGTLLVSHHEEPRCHNQPSPSVVAGATPGTPPPQGPLGTCADYVHAGDAPTPLVHEQQLTSSQYGGYAEVLCLFDFGNLAIVRFGTPAAAQSGYQAAVRVCSSMATVPGLNLGDESFETAGQVGPNSTIAVCAVVRKGAWMAAADWNEAHVSIAQVNRLLSAVVPRMG